MAEKIKMDNLLSIALSAAVPLHIFDLLERGGPTDEDMRKATETGNLLGEKGDLLLFRSSKKGESAELFNRTAAAIAVLSFCPGGITIFGSHWEAAELRKKFKGKMNRRTDERSKKCPEY